jgi:hypothetical protein
VVNAAGVCARLVAAHVGDRCATAAAIETKDATLAARIEVAAGKVADLDRRLGQIDQASRKPPRGARRDARAVLAGERNEPAGTPPSRPSAPPWPRKAGGSRLRRHRSGTLRRSSAPTPTANAPSGG